MSQVKLEISDAIGTVTFDNDAKRNALGHGLLNELCSALEEAEKAKVRALVLRANPGVRVWSAGHDVGELPQSGRDPLSYDDPLERALRAVRKFHAPVLGLIEGTVWGGAFELVICCDIPIATPGATFAITPAKLGVPYNPAGLLRLMEEMDVSVLREMLFTARPISAQRALEFGVINHVVPAADIDAFVYQMAREICELSPLSIQVAKEQMRLLSNARSLSPDLFERIQGLRRKVYDSADYREGIAAFLEKRRPVWTGA